jgi:hypothetical protein
MIHELRNPIDVETPLGCGKCIAWIDYGPDVNTVWKVVFYHNGSVRNFYDDDIYVYPNKMDGGEIKPHFNNDPLNVKNDNRKTENGSYVQSYSHGQQFKS